MKAHARLAAAAILLAASWSANAVPILYNSTYTATTGPNGTGSFSFDSAIGVITNFVWDFGGVIGGMANAYGAQDVIGDTQGRWIFEVLSETDVHSTVDCINVGCFTVGSIQTGSGPGGATTFEIRGTAAVGSSRYTFYDSLGSVVGQGAITIARAVAPVPEPATLSLLALGLLGLAGARRRRTGA